MSETERKRSIRRGLLICLAIWGAFALIGILLQMAGVDTESSQQSEADGFTIDHYDVYLDVGEDNIVEVTEKIGVNWYEENHHGIYKFTPEWLKYTGKDGKTIRRKSIVNDYKAIGDEYYTDYVNKKARIKIGDPNEYVELGLKEYEIQYTYDMGSDPYEDGDEFIFHAYGDYWGTEIQDPTITIDMPKDIEDCDVHFFTDKYRKNDVTEYVEYHIDGNMLYAKFDGEEYYEDTGKKLEKSLTVDIELPEGYFTDGSWNYGFGSVVISFIVFGITIFMLALWEKYGKDNPKRVMSIEYYPPDDLSSAEIGYIYGNKNKKKLGISTLISLAAKGYIRIDDTEDKKIQITALKGIKPEPEDLTNIVDDREVVIDKLKNNSKDLSPSANTMMKYLFSKGNRKILKSNFTKFEDVKDELVSGGYIKVLSDNEETRWEGHESKKLNYQDYERRLSEYEAEMAKMPKMNKYEKCMYDELFTSSDVILLNEHRTLYKAFNKIEDELENDTKAKVVDLKSNSKIIIGIILTAVTLFLSGFSYSVIEDMDPHWRILYILAFACVPVNAVLTAFMGRKTEYGETISARIKGFREFLNTAEKEDLERLVNENPSYFYNILPYTYVLEISKVWIKKFEDIDFPEMDMGNFDYGSDTSWTHFDSDVYYPPTSSNSGGGSSCGGGCSSCGGGCSSCGGGGSW